MRCVICRSVGRSVGGSVGGSVVRWFSGSVVRWSGRSVGRSVVWCFIRRQTRRRLGILVGRCFIPSVKVPYGQQCRSVRRVDYKVPYGRYYQTVALSIDRLVGRDVVRTFGAISPSANTLLAWRCRSDGAFSV